MSSRTMIRHSPRVRNSNYSLHRYIDSDSCTEFKVEPRINIKAHKAEMCEYIDTEHVELELGKISYPIRDFLRHFKTFFQYF